MTLSDKDLANIKKLIELSLDEKVPDLVKQELKRELSHLPNKDQFYEQMDKLVGELKSMREAYEIMAPKAADHQIRIEKLEKQVFPS